MVVVEMGVGIVVVKGMTVVMAALQIYIAQTKVKFGCIFFGQNFFHYPVGY